MMDRTTEQREQSCEEKARATGQAFFTLIAQDATSDLVVDFWICAQLAVRQSMDDGLTMQDAVDRVRLRSVVARWSTFTGLTDPKLRGAAVIGQAMAAWPNRRLAD